MNGVSIIICCYNSAKRIRKTLEHIYDQNLEGIECELLVIDNNCTDDTVAIVNSFQCQTNVAFPLRIIEQPVPGLSFAREKGIENANYEYLIFCDDDNWLIEDYVRLVVEILSNNPQVGLLAGRSEAVSDIELPHWFFTYQTYYAVGVLGLRSGDVSARGEIWGAGMAFRKSEYLALRKAGFTSLLSDRKGTSLSSGGDTEMCKWYLLAGKKLWYDDRLSFQHYIEKRRLDPMYIDKFRMDNNESQQILQKYDIVFSVLSNNKPMLKHILYFFAHLCIILFLNHEKARRRSSLASLEAINPFTFIAFDHEVKAIKCAQKNIDLI